VLANAHGGDTTTTAAAAAAVMIEPWHFKEAFERGMANEAMLFDRLVASPQVR